MIFGNLNEIHLYKGLNKNLDIAIDFICKGSYKNGIIGKNIIDNNSLFFNVDECKTKSLNECCFELHKKYLDIHVIIEGEEIIGYSSLDVLNSKTSYDNKKDFQILEGEQQYYFNMNKNNFIIFFPNEAHMPLISKKNNSYLKKAIFKIEMSNEIF